MFDWFTNKFKPLAPGTKPVIDWKDPKAKISKYFTVKEALWLPSWGVMHDPSDDEKQNIIKTAQAMDGVRDLIGTPISVSVWIRPKKVNCPTFDPKTIKIDEKDPRKDAKKKALAALDYNAFIGGASASAHIVGMAVDWTSKGTCDAIRAKMKPELDKLGVCVEDLPGSNWVHCDIKPPRGFGGRFFKP